MERFVCSSAELIYEEVIDWEERNKNGLMKEDCSGMHVHFLYHSLKYEAPESEPYSPVLCVSCVRGRRGVGFSLPVLIGQ